MLKLTTLRSPRVLAIAAALALSAALPGAGMVNSAHAAPAIPSTTLFRSISGPGSSASGAQSIYTVTVENDPFGATAINPAAEFGIKKTDGSLVSYSAPGATCVVLPSTVYNLVRCETSSLSTGAEIDLSVTVMFSGKTGVDTLAGAGVASNAPTVIATTQTTVAAQENFPSQNPGAGLTPGSQGFGGGNA